MTQRSHNKLLVSTALCLGSLSISFAATAVTVDNSVYTGTQAYPVGRSGFCEVGTLGEVVLFQSADTRSQTDRYYAGITDATGTIARGTDNRGNPTLAFLRGGSLYAGQDEAISGIVTQSDVSGPNGPTPANPWYWTVWEATADDPTVFDYQATFSRGAIVGQFMIADTTWDNPPGAAGNTPCRAANAAPVAAAGPDQLTLAVGATATLDGSGSTDPDNDALTYQWTQVSGPTVTLSDATALSPTFTVPSGAVATPIVFSLVVNDGTVSSPADQVTLQAVNNAPVANAGVDQDSIIPGMTVTLDGSGSSDPDDDTLTYIWTQTSGTSVTLENVTTASPSFTAPAGGGDVIFELTVSDGIDTSAPDSVIISVQDNVAITSQAIGDYMTVRNAMILSHQPDMQRRIDRLQNRTGGSSGMSLNGFALPGSRKLPVSLSVTGSDMRASSSLSAIGKDGLAGGKIDIWGEAYRSNFTIQNRDGDFSIYYLGADIKVSDDMLIGVLGQVDDIDFDGNIGGLGGDGWMVGPYVTARVSPNLFLDARVAWGKSDNEISPFGTYTDTFETNRTLVAATATGELPLSESVVLRPELGVQYLTEESDSYTDSLGSQIPGQNADQGQLSFAPRIHRDLNLSSGWVLRPYGEIEGIYSFGDNVEEVLGSETRLRIEGGIDAFSMSGWRLTASAFSDGIGNDDFKANGFRVSLSKGFN
ncbi:autotransporter outer membrane beta-barrel domain-containing protein [Robiginitomaculum antarcticum]|uniref:autotransporter outer membrane beta-barrel domain-containing protein n=1 Tax=Robiginitomaculum antarcticum TaxID=437507 RepID=UPI00037CD5FC|nr:autotransporter outer membrane beta-barrel domain-containing protein [Robiginitomaculum antarcticum]